MSLFSFRMKGGNVVVVYAQDGASATEVVREMGLQDTVATVRQITSFAAKFVLTDNGDLQTTLLHLGTLNELAPDYPLLGCKSTFLCRLWKLRRRRFHKTGTLQ